MWLWKRHHLYTILTKSSFQTHTKLKVKARNAYKNAISQVSAEGHYSTLYNHVTQHSSLDQCFITERKNPTQNDFSQILLSGVSKVSLKRRIRIISINSLLFKYLNWNKTVSLQQPASLNEAHSSEELPLTTLRKPQRHIQAPVSFNEPLVCLRRDQVTCTAHISLGTKAN